MRLTLYIIASCGLAAVGVAAGLLVSCGDVDPLECVSGAACVDLGDQIVVIDEGERLCGECRPGALVCEDRTCPGFKGPEPEVFDGLDNNCDCEVDEGFEPPPPPPTPRAEVCNGLDDDLDGVVDDIPAVFSYSGPIETLGVGECAPRVEACVDGGWRALPEILPTQEDCSDGLDNDCDGENDEREGVYQARSILLAVDYSGSMGNRRAQITSAVCQAANEDPNAFFAALVAIAVGGQSGQASLVFPFLPADEACSMMLFAETGLTAAAGALEPQPFAVMLGLDQTDWPTDDRAVLVVTDEALQESPTPLSSVVDVCDDEGFRLVAVVPQIYWDEWMWAAAACNGRVVDLVASLLYEEIRTEVTPLCLQPN